ncbi:MAG: pyridoxal phosphate-dependent aminotransferase [Patescibacteria group bacterium]|nr:pyridoxal phosphate-dependent aminotransferase [Patescibacteria group bacterium]
MRISKRISQINPSLTLALTAKANKMRKEGIGVISFAAGEPDFETPLNIRKKAKEAIDKGFTKYTLSSGIKELKEAIAKKLKRENNLDYDLEEILVSCGAKHSLFNAILTLCNEGDEVILPSPYWVSFPEMIKIAGAKPKIIKTTPENKFKVSPDQLKRAITSKTKLFILNSPQNPAGMVYREDELRELSKIIIKFGIYVLSDEIYEKIIYNGLKHKSIASLNEEIKRLTLVVNGVSKSYSMTGWRIGYSAGPKEIIQAMVKLQDHSTSNPTSISQFAALEALEGPQADLKKMVKEFERRRNYMFERLNSIEDFSLIKPEGAFYCWVNISKIFGKNFRGQKITNSLEFSDLLLEKAKVAIVPGSAFGDINFCRISFATSMEDIVKGLNRIEKFVKELRK